tara:strand:+ start:10360 stop:11157 length:798 start_codon:yes stop_codon:yes gene_type:complete
MSLKYSNTNFFSQIIYLVRFWQIWFYPAYYDFKILYSRTYLGSLYSILSKLISITAISLLWSYILKQEFSDFFPYLLFGMLIWFYITGTLQNSVYSLNKNALLLNCFQFPILTMFFRISFLTLINVLQFLPIFILTYIFLIDASFLYVTFFFIGSILLIISVTLLSTLIGIISSLYRDTGHIINSILGIATMITPLYWKKEMLGKYENLVYLNPFTYYLEVSRDVILYAKLNYISFLMVIIMIFIKIIILHLLFKYKVKKILFIL